MATDTNTLGDDRIGNYRYVRTLLQGQNSTVMEVQQESTGRRFAMKQLLPSQAALGSVRKQFEFEAKLGMELRHPNLIQVHEYVKDKELPYFVMEYFPSTTVRIIVAKPAEQAFYKARYHWILEQAANALVYMHDKGWVHRDIKPENIIVNKSAEARVIDYALAKRVKSGLGKLLGGKPPREGTKSYMSPEQIRREPVAVTADVYSFGITCYELACGRQPFRANSPSELLNKHLSEQPSPPTVFNKEITLEYSDLVMKMIKKRPADRLPTLREFNSRFSKIRIYKDDPAPQAARESF